MLDNVDVAIMTKVNDLAERHGLKPYDFVAVIKVEEDAKGKTSDILAFEVPASGNALREERFDRMLADIGVDEDGRLVKNDYRDIVDALDHALQIAPRSRSRF
jgi:hypothetical protein